MKTLKKFIVGSLFAFLILPLTPAHPKVAGSITVGCDVTELISAINTANSAADPDTIELAADCTYLLTQVNNTDDSVGPNGLPIITTDVTIHGNDATIMRDLEGGAPDFRFFRVASTAALSLHQVTLRFGKANLNFIPFVAYHGGAIFNEGGKLTISASTFVQNSGYVAGGAIFNRDGSVKVSDSLFQQNSSTAGNAGIYSGGGTLEVISSTFRENTGYWGVAIHSTNNTASIRQSLFENNEARISADFFGDLYYPHGIIVQGGTGSLTLEDSIMQDNAGPYGGGIYNYGVMTIRGSTFTRNHGYKGGAIRNVGTLTVIGSTFTENRAARGGGIWSNDTVEVINSTFTRNIGDGHGAGVFNRGLLKVWNSTFARNNAGVRGGNIWSDDRAVAGNTIFVRGKPENCFGIIEPQGGNLRFPARDESCVGTFGDPKLGPLQDNGGPTHTMALEAGSAAINQGVKSICLAAPVDNVDQRGIARIVGDELRCESGAYEVE